MVRVAMSHGINANVVHRWRQLVREGGSTLVKMPMATALATAGDGLVPVSIVDPPANRSNPSLREPSLDRAVARRRGVFHGQP
ncbi:MAG: hypothetical protein MUF20_07395 [Methylotetracoccus sp.]|nr:hypothetical protein [Methylotetracoccus sp.]